MGALQKVYELFSKVGDLRIMLVPVMFIFASIAGVWYGLQEYVPGWVVIALILLILAVGIGYLFVKYIRPWWLKRKGEAAPGEETAEIIGTDCNRQWQTDCTP